MKRKLTRSQSRLEDCLEILGVSGVLLDFLLVNERVVIRSLNKSLQNFDCAPPYLANELWLRDHNYEQLVEICSRFKRITILEIWSDKLWHKDESGEKVQLYNACELFTEDCRGVKLWTWAQKIQKIWILGDRGQMNHMCSHKPLCENFDEIMREPRDIHSRIPRKTWNQSKGLESFLNSSPVSFNHYDFDKFTFLFPNLIFLDIRCGYYMYGVPDFTHMRRLRKMKYLLVSGIYDCKLNFENFKKIPMEQLEHLQLMRCISLKYDEIASQILTRGKNLEYYQGKAADDGLFRDPHRYKILQKKFKAMHGHDIIICPEDE